VEGIIHKTNVKEQPRLTCKHLKCKQGKIFKVLKDENLHILKNKGNHILILFPLKIERN